MGVVATIRHDTMPKAGSTLGKRVEVCFHYNMKEVIGGEIVRNDSEQPFLTIIKLDDGRYVLATECQYRLLS